MKYGEYLLAIAGKYRIEPNGCWTFLGFINDNGYGDWRFHGHTRRAHRVSYLLRHGSIPEGLDLDHTCHRQGECAGGKTCPHRRCINPDHLNPVTRSINIQRGVCGLKWDEKPIPTHCKWGHGYTPENMYVFGERLRCKACAAQRVIDCRQRQRDARNAELLNARS